MKTLVYTIYETEDNTFKTFSMTEYGSFLCQGEFLTFNDAEVFITQTCKPTYYENFGSGYELKFLDSDSKELNDIFLDLEDVLDFIQNDMSSFSYKWTMFKHNLNETLKKAFNLFLSCLN